MAFQFKALELKEFNGGMTDDYINAELNQAQIVWNMFVLNNKNLRTRFGTELDSTVPGTEQIPSLTPLVGQNIHALINYYYDDTLFVHSGPDLFYRNPVNWTQVLGPTGNQPFPYTTEAQHIAHTQWNGHLICVSGGNQGVKIFKDNTNAVKCLSLGFPAVSSPTLTDALFLPFSIAIADNPPFLAIPGQISPFNVTVVNPGNDTMTKVGHGLETGQRIQFSYSAGAIVPLPPATNFYIIKVDNNNFKVATTLANAQAGINVDMTSVAGVVTTTVEPLYATIYKVSHGLKSGQVVRISSTGAVPTPLLENTDYYVIRLDDDYFMLAENYTNATATTPVPIAMEPDYSGTLTITPQKGTGAYIYAFFYRNTYQVFNQTFVDEGPVTYKQILDVYSPDISPIEISNLPFGLPFDENHDPNSTIEIYRTISGGQEFYRVGSIPAVRVPFGPDFTDNFSDDAIQLNETIYTSGGIPSNDPPPKKATFVHTVNGFTYYAGMSDSPYTVKQSQRLDPDSVPAAFEDQLEDTITGLSSVQDVPIVGCSRHIYRIEGSFDETGRGGMSHRRISDHAGCLSHDSFVQAEGNLFWFGVDGIYMTEGFKCMKVTDGLNGTYRKYMDTLNNKTRKIKGTYNPLTRTIYWTFSHVDKGTGNEECDAIWLLDLMWGISPEMVCSMYRGFSTFSPSALTFYKNKLYRADKRGYVLYFAENIGADPQIIPGVTNDNWYRETIMWQYTWISHNFDGTSQRKIANKIAVDAVSKTNYSIAITAINDEGRITRDLQPIRYRRNFQWGDEDWMWGLPTFNWYYGGISTVDRRLPAKGLRFNYLQLELKNDFTVIVNSDQYGDALVDNATDTVFLNGAPTVFWPSQSKDYYIFLEQDNFVHGFKILSRTVDTLVIENPTKALIDGNQRWEIKGYKKGEVVQLSGMSISYAPISRSYDTFNVGDDGELA